MAAQHGNIHVRGPAAWVDRNGSFKIIKTQLFCHNSCLRKRPKSSFNSLLNKGIVLGSWGQRGRFLPSSRAGWTERLLAALQTEQTGKRSRRLAGKVFLVEWLEPWLDEGSLRQRTKQVRLCEQTDQKTGTGYQRLARDMTYAFLHNNPAATGSLSLS